MRKCHVSHANEKRWLDDSAWSGARGRDGGERGVRENERKEGEGDRGRQKGRGIGRENDAPPCCGNSLLILAGLFFTGAGGARV